MVKSCFNLLIFDLDTIEETTFELRIPLTFDVEGVHVIGDVINDVVVQYLGETA